MLLFVLTSISGTFNETAVAHIRRWNALFHQLMVDYYVKLCVLFEKAKTPPQLYGGGGKEGGRVWWKEHS